MIKLTKAEDDGTTRMEGESRLLAVLLRHGQSDLAKLLDVSESEVSRKINGDSGWKLDQLAKAFEFVGAQILSGDGEHVIVKRDELTALRTLARKSLEAKE